MKTRTTAQNQTTHVMAQEPSGLLVEAFDLWNGVDPNWDGLWHITPLGEDWAVGRTVEWHTLGPVRMQTVNGADECSH